MGCKASKSAVAEGPVPPQHRSQRPQQQQQSQQRSKTYDTAQEEGARSHTSPVVSGSTMSSNYTQQQGVVSHRSRGVGKSRSDETSNTAGSASAATASTNGNNALYNLIMQAQAQCLVHLQQQQQTNSAGLLLERIVQKCNKNPKLANYQHPMTGATPLHQACRLLDYTAVILSVTATTSRTSSPNAAGGGSPNSATRNRTNSVSAGVTPLSLLEALMQAYPDAVRIRDHDGYIPLHYVIAPTTTATLTTTTLSGTGAEWRDRAAALQLLLMIAHQQEMDHPASDKHNNNTVRHYLACNAVEYGSASCSKACSPLYRAIESLPDDFEGAGPTVEFLSLLRDAAGCDLVDVGNASDGDKPLALLYRRFTRQFDLAEKFFAGDNSRPEVVEHRQRYKTAAGNTWRIIELLLRPDDPKEKWRIVHRAVQVETPPDLLRYIVETNSEDLTVPDAAGNLPLHYAAKSKPHPHPLSNNTPSNYSQKNNKKNNRNNENYPAFYTKYVVDELLYKYPEAASIPNAEGNFPFTLAVKAGKQWIGGGIKSLFDAYPQALKQINLSEHPSLQHVLSDSCAILDAQGGGAVLLTTPSKEEKDDSIIRDEQHDAIMLVQQPGVDVSEVVASMWAHEEDPGVQMLSCVALARLVRQAQNDPSEILRIALTAVAGVVNAMKAHPNEVIVQEKACHALKLMASTDGKREVSFVASGSVAAIVGAMQAHVSDPGVQEEACGAVASVIHYGGADRATIVASVSGLTAIINAIAAHPDTVGVQQQGCLALKELTEYDKDADSNLPELPRSQTEPLLQAAKKQFPTECGALVDQILSRLSTSS